MSAESWPLPLQKDTDEEVREFLNNNLHLQGKVSGFSSCFTYQEIIKLLNE